MTHSNTIFKNNNTCDNTIGLSTRHQTFNNDTIIISFQCQAENLIGKTIHVMCAFPVNDPTSSIIYIIIWHLYNEGSWLKKKFQVDDDPYQMF